MEDIDTIISELEAPLKTFRIFAIEKAIKSGASARLLEKLKSRRLSEDDAECLMLLDHAICSVQERLVQASPAPSMPQSKVSMADFARLKADEQLQIIKKTSSSAFKSANISEGLRQLLDGAAHDVVKAEIVKKCWSFWPKDFFDYLSDNLFSTSSTLQMACLEAIIHTSPETLQKNFDKLVISRDPLIRAMAIRGLAKKYPRNAASFLADSLRKGDYFSRLAALRAISVMPFNLNRNSILELLAHEHDQRLLKIAAAIILANPDREIPFRICDIIEKSTSARADFLAELQKNCCSMIRMRSFAGLQPVYADPEKIPKPG
jgi:hypothetical protein